MPLSNNNNNNNNDDDEAQNSVTLEASREISKQWIGVPPGSPAPGAYQVSRRASRDIPVWEREDETNDSDTEANPVHSHDESHIMTVETIHENDDKTLPRDRNRKYFRRMFLIVLVVMIIVAITIGVTMSGKNKPKPQQGTQKLNNSIDEELQIYWLNAIVDACETNKSISDAIKLVPAGAMEKAVALLTDMPLFATMKEAVYHNCTTAMLAFWWLVADVNYYNVEQKMERYALVLLYLALGGKGWAHNQGWLSNLTICDWEGITCHLNMEVVDALLLIDLAGTLPTELALLTNMQQLFVSTSIFLTGQLPSEIGLLSNLVQLQFTNTAMSGKIPSEIGHLTGLYTLSLNENTFTGKVPAVIGTMTNLIELDLSHNVLEGVLPLEFWQLTQLELLDISSNPLKTSLATEIGLLTSLNQFAASSSFLSGTIPSSIGMCTLLTHVDVSSNQLTGSIPLEMANLTNIEYLMVQDNHLTGTILDSVCGLSSLISLITIGCTESLQYSLVCPQGCCTTQCNVL